MIEFTIYISTFSTPLCYRISFKMFGLLLVWFPYWDVQALTRSIGVLLVSLVVVSVHFNLFLKSFLLWRSDFFNQLNFDVTFLWSVTVLEVALIVVSLWDGDHWAVRFKVRCDVVHWWVEKANGRERNHRPGFGGNGEDCLWRGEHWVLNRF